MKIFSKFKSIRIYRNFYGMLAFECNGSFPFFQYYGCHVNGNIYNSVMVALIGAFGASLGEFTGYFTGYYGSAVVENSAILIK